MVHFVRRIAIAVEADVAAMGALAIDEEAEAGLDVWVVSAYAEFGGVIIIVVIDGGDACLELRIVRDLDDHIMIGASLGVVVPQPDGVDGSGFLQIDLDPLEAVEQFDEISFASLFIAIGDEVERTDDRVVVAAGYLFPLESRAVPWGTKNTGA